MTVEKTNLSVVEDDLEKLVPCIIPRDDSGKKSKTLRITLNDKSIVVPRGEVVEIPLKYKLVLDKKAKIRNFDEEYKEAEQAKRLKE